MPQHPRAGRGGPSSAAHDQRGRTPVRRRLAEDVRRAEIIEATVAVVGESGYQSASLARIAERAMVSKGLVSHHFGDREHLMELAARTTLVTLTDAVTTSLVTTGPVPEVIRAAIHRAARLPATHGVELGALRQIIANLRDPDGGSRFGLADYREIYRAQENLFRRGQDEGAFRSFDTGVMALTYQGAIDTMLTYLHEHPEADPDSYADELADLMIAAMAHR
ncbi:TetR/AcrR family transcriptional regulator [Actinomycetes bacterium KLBMP 9759]